LDGHLAALITPGCAVDHNGGDGLGALIEHWGRRGELPEAAPAPWKCSM
jgi:hypothetical protein